MCNQWPVAKLLLTEVSRVSMVSVPLWRRLLQSSSMEPQGSKGHHSANKGQSEIATLLPESIQRVLEAESWAELALHFDTDDVLLLVQAGELHRCTCTSETSSKRALCTKTLNPFATVQIPVTKAATVVAAPQSSLWKRC